MKNIILVVQFSLINEPLDPRLGKRIGWRLWVRRATRFKGFTMTPLHQEWRWHHQCTGMHFLHHLVRSVFFVTTANQVLTHTLTWQRWPSFSSWNSFFLTKRVDFHSGLSQKLQSYKVEQNIKNKDILKKSWTLWRKKLYFMNGVLYPSSCTHETFAGIRSPVDNTKRLYANWLKENVLAKDPNINGILYSSFCQSRIGVVSTFCENH